MNKRIFFVLICFLTVFLLVGASCVNKNTNNQPIVGGDRDEHGCIGSAGYSWCEVKQKCLRIWEEKCEAQQPSQSVNNNIVETNNQFAFELYSKYQSKAGNIFFSPYSISTALAMTYEGARGKTAEEMQSVFHFLADSAVRQQSFLGLYNELNKKDKKYQLNTANALWAQKDYSFLKDYFDVTEKYYGAKVTNLDFKTETEKSRTTINSWVEKQTNNKIKNLIPSGALDPLTRLVLTNAIYFKGTWLKQFDKKNTQDQDFKTDAGNNIKTPMMSLTGKTANFNYMENDQIQLLELPYDGKDLSMMVILPKNNDLKSTEKSLNTKNLLEWQKNFKEERIDVYLPKFKFDAKYLMAKDLQEMGMPTAFDPNNADFSGMTGNKDLYITNVIHQAFVEVNEEGTEAAAATGVVMGVTSFRPVEQKIFRADHPFIFLIQNKTSGAILFLGRMANLQ